MVFVEIEIPKQEDEKESRKYEFKEEEDLEVGELYEVFGKSKEIQEELWTSYELVYNGNKTIDIDDRTRLSELIVNDNKIPFNLVLQKYNLETIKTHILKFLDILSILDINEPYPFGLFNNKYNKSVYDKMEEWNQKEIEIFNKELKNINDPKINRLIDISMNDKLDESILNVLFKPEIKYGFKKCKIINDFKILNLVTLPKTTFNKDKGDLLYIYIKLNTDINNEFYITCNCNGFIIDNSIIYYKTLPLLLINNNEEFRINWKLITDKYYLDNKNNLNNKFNLNVYNNLNFSPYVYINTKSNEFNDKREEELLNKLSDVLPNSYSENNINNSNRDWNEELQTARELSTNTNSEKILKDVTISNILNDFNNCVINGAIGIINGLISPLNTSNSKHFHNQSIYVHNGILFTKYLDSNESFEDIDRYDAAHLSVSKDLINNIYINKLNLKNINTVAMAIIDYHGHRISAQSIIPGLISNSLSLEKMLVSGSLNDDKLIVSNKEFNQNVKELSNKLNLSSHIIKDINNKEHEFNLSVNTKGIKGTDNRKYIVDLYRCTPMDIGFIKMIQKNQKQENKEYSNYPHQLTLIRLELLQNFIKNEFNEYLKYKAEEHNKFKELNKKKKNKNILQDNRNGVFKVIGTKDGLDLNLNLNPDIGTKLLPIDEMKDIDKKKFELIFDYLMNKVIPKYVLEFIKDSKNIPIDSLALINGIHKQGINIRYLGILIKEYKKLKLKHNKDNKDEKNNKDYFIIICEQEIIIRSLKYIIRKEMRKEENIVKHKEIVVNIFNEFLKEEKELKCKIKEISKNKFGYIDEEIKKTYELRKTEIIREICKKLGIQINISKFIKEDNQIEIKQEEFENEDIYLIYPKIKKMVHESEFANELQENGKISIEQGDYQIGLELMNESYKIQELISGISEPLNEISRELYKLHFKMEKKEECKDVLITSIKGSETMFGIDDYRTLNNYMDYQFDCMSKSRLIESMTSMIMISNLWKMMGGRSHKGTQGFEVLKNRISLILQREILVQMKDGGLDGQSQKALDLHRQTLSLLTKRTVMLVKSNAI